MAKINEECVFCKISEGEIIAGKIYENDNFFSIYDKSPDMEGHALVISKKHFQTFLDVPVSLGQELLDALKKTSVHLMKKHKAEGFNIVNNNFAAAGQIVNHVHFHILPRTKSIS